MGKPADAARYQRRRRQAARRLLQDFFDPVTGVLAGWRSADGQLHDYYFLLVNGIAIHYGLVPKPQANAIMDKLLAKMKQSAMTSSTMGLPGNLITVALKDYVHKSPMASTAAACFPTIPTASRTTRMAEPPAASPSLPWLRSMIWAAKPRPTTFSSPCSANTANVALQGRDAEGRSNDWRRWDGTPMGYEGYLIDNYYALLAVPLRQSETRWGSGFRPTTALS